MYSSAILWYDKMAYETCVRAGSGLTIRPYDTKERVRDRFEKNKLGIGTFGAGRLCDRQVYRHLFRRKLFKLRPVLRPEFSGGAGSRFFCTDLWPDHTNHDRQCYRRCDRSGGIPIYQVGILFPLRRRRLKGDA